MSHLISTMFIPLTLLGLAVLIYPELGVLPSAQLAMLKFLPVIVAAVSLSLCFRFNRSLMFFATLSLLLAYVLMQWYLPSLGAMEEKIIWLALGILLPFNFAAISLLKERGMLTWWGCSRFALLLLPISICVIAAQYYPEPLLDGLSWRFTEWHLLNQVSFPQITLLVMVFSVLVLNGKWFMRTSAQTSALFVAMITGIAMLYFEGDAAINAVFACAAMVMLLIAVIQESWSMAYIDQLTGLPGRRALEEEMLKLGGNYSIAMMDIDHFKKFNDSYGHDAGDQVLQMVAARIKQSASGGKAFRYGGEEFTLVFPGKKTSDTLDVLEAVRESVSGSKFQLRKKDRRSDSKKKDGGKNVQVTISIGVANRSDEIATPHEVIKQADTVLYKAKKQGRNRVCK